MKRLLFLAILLISSSFPQKTVNAAFAIFQAASNAPAGCVPNGSDGFASAPAGIGQYSTLLSTYGSNVPAWCVAGVGYAVGPQANATNSGDTITETGVLNIPVNGDKRTLYAKSGGALPSGPTEGTQYFICGVSGSSTTYSYTLNTSSGCGAGTTVALGASSGFIILKVPGSVTNTPTNTSGWNGLGGVCGSNLVFDICATGSSVTLDHWDFTQGGGWTVHQNTAASLTVTNNKFQIGTNMNGVILDGGGNPNGLTFSYNDVDGNATAIYTTANGATASGATVNVTSTAGIAVNMTVCDVTKPSAISCPGVFVSSIGAGSVTLSSAISSSVNNGDTLGFVRAPYSFPPRSIYQQPQISLTTKGTLTAQYNRIRNTYSEHWQHGIASGSTGVAVDIRFNVFDNTGWGVPVTGAITHSDVVQIYGVSGGSFGAMTLSYNTVIQNNSQTTTDSTSFNVLASGTFGATGTTFDSSNNVGIFTAGNPFAATYGLMVVNPKWFSTSVAVNNNYVDPTSACASVGTCGATYWAAVNAAGGGGTGPSTPSCASSGNVNLSTGAALPKPFGSYC